MGADCKSGRVHGRKGRSEVQFRCSFEESDDAFKRRPQFGIKGASQTVLHERGTLDPAIIVGQRTEEWRARIDSTNEMADENDG